MSAKSKDKAEATRNDLGGSGADAGGTVANCKAKKHFIKVVVQDEDGNPVTDVKPTVDVDASAVSVAVDKKGTYDSKKVIDSDDDAKITFPSLLNCDWWPSTDPKPNPAGDADLTAVADGDCIVKMAATAGFRCYTDIWAAPENAALKTNRPNPNSLLVGDVFKGPDKKDKSVDKAVDAEWTFTIRSRKKPKLRIRIVDKELKPLANATWNMTGIAAKKGKSGADGLIEVLDIDAQAVAGVLTITPEKVKHPKKTKEKPAKLTDPPQYPLPLKEENFEDEKPQVQPFLTNLAFDLKIGSLPSHKDKTGTLARMHNLGFLRATDAKDEDVTHCVKAYQKIVLNSDAGSGAHADIKDDIETRHTNA